MFSFARAFRRLGCLSVVLLSAAPVQGRPPRRTVAPADETSLTGDRRACQTAFMDGRQHLEAGRLREARRYFGTCADPVCGRSIEHECAARRTQLDGDIPSIVPVLLDRAGSPIVDAQVTVDGEPLTTHLDGRAFTVDPGLHEVSFDTGSEVVAVKVLAGQGQRNQLVSASIGRGAGKQASLAALPRAETETAGEDGDADDDAPLAPTERAGRSVRGARAKVSAAEAGPSSSLPLYFLGGLGVAGLLGYGTVVTWARDDNHRLLDCAPNCPPASIDHIRKLYLIADVSLGVGVAALAATTWVYVATRPSRKELAYSLDLRLTPSGAVAAVGGRF
ncbi:MAG TPA: hypothetical protein VGL59_07515 [Polyangia bacterium]|jgi:hypothetical protein